MKQYEERRLSKVRLVADLQLLSFLACLLLPAAARAQVGPSATYNRPRLTVGGTFSFYHLTYGSRNELGETVYFDARISYHLGAEGEVRWLNLHTPQNVHDETYLIGPAYTFDEFHHYQPYAKLLVGNGQFNFSYNDAHGGYLAAAAGGGLNRQLNNRWLLRVVDFEYQHWPGFTGGPFSQFGVSGGIAYRIW